MLFKKKFLAVLFISAFSLACTFEPLYSDKFLLEYEIIEPSKSKKELHEIFRNLNNLTSINENGELIKGKVGKDLNTEAGYELSLIHI